MPGNESGSHDPPAQAGLDLLRLYEEVAVTWPVDVRPRRATHPGGVDWILNADAWTHVDTLGWEPARFFWEIVGARTRFKVEWKGETAMRMHAREAFRESLEAAASDLGIPVARTRRRPGSYMTALEFPGDLSDEVLVNGALDVGLSRALYDRATLLFESALPRLRALERRIPTPDDPASDWE